MRSVFLTLYLIHLHFLDIDKMIINFSIDKNVNDFINEKERQREILKKSKQIKAYQIGHC